MYNSYRCVHESSSDGQAVGLPPPRPSAFFSRALARQTARLRAAIRKRAGRFARRQPPSLARRRFFCRPGCIRSCIGYTRGLGVPGSRVYPGSGHTRSPGLPGILADPGLLLSVCGLAYRLKVHSFYIRPQNIAFALAVVLRNLCVATFPAVPDAFWQVFLAMCSTTSAG